jgi:N-acetylglutamate synthase
MALPVSIRTFEFADYEAARGLWEASEGVGLSGADEPQAIRAYLVRNPGLSFVAAERGEIVGTILCGHDGRRGFVHHLVTAESHRRRGIARALLNRGLAALRDVGVQKCHMFVFKANADGIAFWRTVGAEERLELTLFSLATSDNV